MLFFLAGEVAMAVGGSRSRSGAHPERGSRLADEGGIPPRCAVEANSVRSHYKRAHVRKLFYRLDGWLVRRIWSHRPVVGTFYLATSDRSHRFIAILCVVHGGERKVTNPDLIPRHEKGQDS
jgi:hypothetical protein